MTTAIALQRWDYMALISGTSAKKASANIFFVDKPVTLSESWSTTAYIDSSNDIIEFLSKNGTYISSPSEIKSYFDNNSDLVKALFKIPTIFKEQFNCFNTRLEFTYDPEYPQQKKDLVLTVKTKLNPSEALAALDRVEDNFISEFGVDVFNSINFNVEYL